ncbi:phage minor capsid protein [Niallia taxi]|uniref:phage minor capsid protein n=1 Tax=Niallia taxi TaxID=2499688 RepID=UPI003182281B
MSVLDIYRAIEAALMANIAQFFASGQSLLTDNTLQWQMQKLNDLGALNRSNTQLIAQYAGISMVELNTHLEKEGLKGLNEQEKELAKAAVSGQLVTPVNISEDAALYSTLATYQANAHDKLNLTNTNIIGNSAEKVKQIVNQTTAEVLSGVITPQQALTKNAIEFARQGIPAYVNYESNRQYSIEAYTQMIVRTTTNQVTASMQMTRAESYGVDLIEVSSHVGARPKCSVDQGKIYSRSGNNDNYPPFSSTSFGELDGLFGINCGHTVYPFWEGKSRQAYKPIPKKENDKAYIESQKQRALERNIRLAKRELDFLKNANLPHEGAQKKVSASQAKMRGFIEDTGRTRRYARERSISQ